MLSNLISVSGHKTAARRAELQHLMPAEAFDAFPLVDAAWGERGRAPQIIYAPEAAATAITTRALATAAIVATNTTSAGAGVAK